MLNKVDRFLYVQLTLLFLNIEFNSLELKINVSRIKYKINYNPVNYNTTTGKYESGNETYTFYSQAKVNLWKCDKCAMKFGTFRSLRKHKSEVHAY